MNTSKVGTVLLFAALFVFIGWVTPMMAYSHAPQEQFIEAHEFHAENISVGADDQTVCFDRTVHVQSTGTVFVELYLVTDGGEKIEVLSNNNELYFQEGRQTISDQIELDRELETGKYRYERVYRMDVYKGSVTRTFSFTSEPFYITKDETESYRC